ncbi:hypothetical protein ACH4TE_32490 [Streptomyces sioyaensis]|uniref:hypothetical protein n=1 Tax=Streptomyces sioyaensis TaxID=67364 RepID=UPI00378EDD9B
MTPDHTDSAKPARTPADSSAPRVVARKGVLSAVRPDPHQLPQPEPEPVFYGLHITAEPEWRISVTAACPCGYLRQVRGRAAVLRVIEEHASHMKTCPRRAGIAERRRAA